VKALRCIFFAICNFTFYGCRAWRSARNRAIMARATLRNVTTFLAGISVLNLPFSRPVGQMSAAAQVLGARAVARLGSAGKAVGCTSPA